MDAALLQNGAVGRSVSREPISQLSNLTQPFPEFLFDRSHLEGISKRQSPVVSLRAPPNGITGYLGPVSSGFFSAYCGEVNEFAPA